MKKILFALYLISCFAISAYAEKITLKSGKVIEGEIVEKTADHIKIKETDLTMTLTYYMDDIESIEGASGLSQAKDEKGTAKDDLSQFKLGICNAGENEIEFKFPMEKGGLYAFSMKDWADGRSDQESRLVISLYDKNKKLIEKAKSVCVPKNMKSFGSIAFNTTKEDVSDIGYFDAKIEACVKKEAVKLDNNEPQVLFAQKVSEAIKKSKEAFLALELNKPSEEMVPMEDFMYQNVKGMLDSGAILSEVVLIEGKEAEKYKSFCSKPYMMTISSASNGSSTSMGFPIGEVKGEWKILNIE
ncbi:MAG: hypothetical protein WCY05_07495 [Candidatus Omnitrophota bacterium]